jgi:hypothetical protein
MLVSSLGCSLALKVEAIRSSKSLNYFHQTKGHMSKKTTSQSLFCVICLEDTEEEGRIILKMDLMMRCMVVAQHYAFVLAVLKLRVRLSQCLLVNYVPYRKLMTVYQILILTFLSISVMLKRIACKLYLLSLGLCYGNPSQVLPLPLVWINYDTLFHNLKS